MAGGKPVRYTYGIGTQPIQAPFGDYPLPDPVSTCSASQGYRVHTYHTDFVDLLTGEWTLSGTGTPTYTAGAAQGGAVVLTTTTGTTDSAILLKNNASFAFNSGYKGWYKSAFTLSDVTHCTYVSGIADGAALNNGLYFSMAAGGVVSLIASASGTPTTLVASVTTLTASTQVELALYYNGTDLLVFVNGGIVARVASLSMATTQITPVFELTNTTGVARTATIDYIVIAEEMNAIETAQF